MRELCEQGGRARGWRSKWRSGEEVEGSLERQMGGGRHGKGGGNRGEGERGIWRWQAKTEMAMARNKQQSSAENEE